MGARLARASAPGWPMLLQRPPNDWLLLGRLQRRWRCRIPAPHRARPPTRPAAVACRPLARPTLSARASRRRRQLRPRGAGAPHSPQPLRRLGCTRRLAGGLKARAAAAGARRGQRRARQTARGITGPAACPGRATPASWAREGPQEPPNHHPGAQPRQGARRRRARPVSGAAEAVPPTAGRPPRPRASPPGRPAALLGTQPCRGGASAPLQPARPPQQCHLSGRRVCPSTAGARCCRRLPPAQAGAWRPPSRGARRS